MEKGAISARAYLPFITRKPEGAGELCPIRGCGGGRAWITFMHSSIPAQTVVITRDLDHQPTSLLRSCCCFSSSRSASLRPAWQRRVLDPCTLSAYEAVQKWRAPPRRELEYARPTNDLMREPTMLALNVLGMHGNPRRGAACVH